MKFQDLQNNLTARGFKCYSPDDGGHYYFEIPNQGTVPNNAFYFAEVTFKIQRIDIYPSYNDGFCHNVYYLSELKEKTLNNLCTYHLKSFKRFKEHRSLEQIKKDFE